MTELDQLSPQEIEVLVWRRQQLLDLGFDSHEAIRLADHLDVDLEQIRRLLEHGCPADLVEQIVL